MKKPPSRAEIENALSNNHRNSSLGDSNKLNHTKEIPQNRKRTIIGGNLSGISKRNRAREHNYANWIAGIIALLILIVFFWPQPKRVTNEISVTPEELQKDALYSNSRVDQSIIEEKNKKQEVFTRTEDTERAEQFRQTEQQENKITQLLKDADTFIQKGQYLTPKDQSALVKYNEVLVLAPNNTAASQGIEYIRHRFYKIGSQALTDKDVSVAQDNLKKLGFINKQSEEYIDLALLIENTVKQQQIEEYLANASQAKLNEEYILPAKSNALYFYQQALELDADNTSAKNGIEQIANHYINLANKAVLNSDFGLATGYLSTVSVIDAEHPSLPLIKKMIDYGKPLADKRALALANEKTNQRIIEEGINTVNTNPSIPPPTTSSEANSNKPVVSAKTPPRESGEQELFDRQYLQNGLNAYYLGDYEMAKSLLQPLADKGISRAQFRIAYMHYLGRGFEKNKDEADRIIRAALPAVKSFAEEGRTWAQSDLGSLYEDGLVLPRDYPEAIYWYRRAAELGYPGAQTNLGAMYARGRGVTTSRRTAIEWFQRAAKQGDDVARRNLESMGVQF